MNPVIEIFCQGEKVCLGAFAIRGRKGGMSGYRTAGITTRAILRQRQLDIATADTGVSIAELKTLTTDEAKVA